MFWLLDTRNAVAVVLGGLGRPAGPALPGAPALQRDRARGQPRRDRVRVRAAGRHPVLAVAGGSSWAPGLLLVGIALVTTVSGLVAPRLYVPETELTVEGVASRRG
jgi:hypothetical protein